MARLEVRHRVQGGDSRVEEFKRGKKKEKWLVLDRALETDGIKKFGSNQQLPLPPLSYSGFLGPKLGESESYCSLIIDCS
jgi:hypothetical protein